MPGIKLVSCIMIMFVGLSVNVAEAVSYDELFAITGIKDYWDVSGNGEVSAYDIALILRRSAGFIDEFPVERGIALTTATKVNVSIPDSKSPAGSKVLIPINVSDTSGKGIIGIDITLNYDPDILTAIGIAMKFLFSVDLGFQSELDNGIISESLRQKFTGNGILLSQDANLLIEDKGVRWRILDGQKTYIIRNENDKLGVYKPDDTIIASDWIMISKVSSGKIEIRMMRLTELSGAGTLVRIEFSVVSTASIGDISLLELRISFNEGGVPANITNGTFEVVERQLLQQQIHLYRGWNLISIALEPEDNSLLSVLAPVKDDCVSVWTYDAEWKYYIFDALTGELTTMGPDKGYWINMTDERDLNITGREIIDTAIILKKGWNLVGYKYMSSRSTADALSMIREKCKSIWGYNTQTGWMKYIPDGDERFNDLVQLNSGSGYWIYVTEDCIWDMGL